MSDTEEFQLPESIAPGAAHPQCRACIIIPARNEELDLPATLNALAAQVDLADRPLSPESFEILLLLNNCTDNSAQVARRWQAMHLHIHLHVIERVIDAPHAHVGTARRMLMDTACRRLGAHRQAISGILSTDADSIVAPDWIVQNLCALERGADAVGGQIRLKDGDLELLPAGARRAYLNDRQYQKLVAQLEGILDPQPGDPLPRHLEHFGASLACTVSAYKRAGGMPPVTPLEDVAFVDALLRANLCLRHEPSVVVYTSSRLDGRAEVGLSHQLRTWQRMSEQGEPHMVPSASWVVHRSRMLHQLRLESMHHNNSTLKSYPKSWRSRMISAQREGVPLIQVLGREACERLIEDTFRGERHGPIHQVNRNLARAIQRWTAAANSAANQALEGKDRAVQFHFKSPRNNAPSNQPALA